VQLGDAGAEALEGRDLRFALGSGGDDEVVGPQLAVEGEVRGPVLDVRPRRESVPQAAELVLRVEREDAQDAQVGRASGRRLRRSRRR
jgi:hypothetical protein